MRQYFSYLFLSYISSSFNLLCILIKQYMLGQELYATGTCVHFYEKGFTTEAIAVRFGLNLANIVGCSKIEVNSDSMEVVNTLSQGYSSPVTSSIIDDCYFMSLGFSHVIYDHCNREHNRVAHELARLARFSSPSVWMDNAPDEVIPLLVTDATLLMNE
ncbi:hypothetical protein ACQJBY_064372 [Aegilops geniculata]